MKKLFLFSMVFFLILSIGTIHSADKDRHAHPQCLRINMDAAPTVGFAPLFVRFNSLTESAGVSYFWDFGDGKTGTGRNPIHRYDESGVYTVTLTLTREDELSIMEYEELITVYNDSTHRGRCNLKIVEHSHTYPKEGWENTLDGDTYKESGTTTAGQDPAWVIYAFEDDKILTIDKVRLITRTETKMKSNWINRFRVSVSLNGTYFTEFQPVLEADRTSDDWETFEFEPVAAKYVKLEVLDPYEHWCQIGEFEVYEAVTLPDLTNSDFTVETTCLADSQDACQVEMHLADVSNAPVSGLPSSAFRIIASGELFAQTMVTETETPGTYIGSLKSFYPGEKEISVKVYGQEIGSSSTTIFQEPNYYLTNLEFIKGTPCINNMEWDNAVDGNWDGMAATTWAGPRYADAWGLFQFTDSTTHLVNKLRVITDTGIQKKSNETTLYQVWISATDTAATSFKLFHEAVKDGGDWETYKFLPVEVKYVKLVLPEPRQNFRLFGELELYSPIETMRNPRNDGTTEKHVKYVTEKDPKPLKTLGSGLTYPNPFNPATQIVYELNHRAEVRILIFNLKGQIVRHLLSQNQVAGQYQLSWNGRDDAGQMVPSGQYWCRLQTNAGNKVESQSIKMTLLK